MHISLILHVKYIIQNEDADEYTVGEEESDIGDDNDEMFDIDDEIEDGDDVSDYVCSDGEEEEMEDIEVFYKTLFILYDLLI